MSNSRKVYLNVIVRCNNKEIPVRALIDTGNTVRAKSVMDKKLHEKLGAGFSAIGGAQIQTAKRGSGLTKIGRSKEIEIRIPGITHKFSIKPTVTENLSDELNLGNGFLAQIGRILECSLVFKGKRTKLKIGAEEVELIQTIGAKGLGGEHSQDPQETKSERLRGREYRPADIVTSNGVRLRTRDSEPERVSHLSCSQDVKIKKNTLRFIEVDPARQIKKDQEIVVETLPGNEGELVEAVRAVYRWNENKIAVLNASEYDVELKRGTRIAKYETFRGGNPDSEEKVREIKEVTGKPDFETLITKLKIEENPILQRNPGAKERLKEMIKEYADVFSDPEEGLIGTTSLIDFKIKLKPDAQPVRHRLRPLNPNQRASLRKQLDTWQRENVIEESNSPWASPLVPAAKKGGEIRWAVDYRAINSMTIGDAWPVPSIEENLEKLQGARYFSAIDAAAAYHTVPVEAKSRPYLAFLTPYGTFQFKKMPFGAKNAGATYSRLVELAIMKLRSPSILAYIDDIICATAGLTEHLEELEKVFRMHREAGIKVKPEKTQLIKEDVEYLGYVVSEEGVKMQDEYVRKIVEWPRPSTTKELNSFLGFRGYYRTFIPRFSELTNELNSMRKESKIVWSEEIERKFIELKEEFSKKPIRAYPDYNSGEPFQVAVDFSKENVAGILSQVQNGQEKFIAAAGRKTTKYERNYHSTKGELSAIIYALRKWEHILRFKQFWLWTDSKALVYLQTMKKLTGMYFRWLSEIQSYDFIVRHRPGKQNSNADGMSRSNHLDPPTKEEEEEEEGYIHRLHQWVNGL